MKHLRHLFFVLLAFVAGFAGSKAYAQQLIVATGDPKGTYSQMFKEAQQFCVGSLKMVEKNTSGSVANVELLSSNEANAAFVQADVLKFRSMSEDFSGIKALVVLHPEEVHFVAANKVKKEGGLWGIGGTKYQLKDVADLAGRTVGAAGGSVISAKVISAQSGLKFNVQEYPTNDAALAALRADEIDAFVAVGGAPLTVISGLTDEFRLLTVPNEITGNERLSAIYTPAKLNYPKMGAQGVPSISTQSLLVTRDYKTAAYVTGLNEFRKCLISKLDEIRETTGTHRKWQQVPLLSKGEKTLWPLYER